MTTKTKNILYIVGVCLLLAGVVLFFIRDVFPTTDGDVTPDSTMVDTLSLPMVDSLVVDTVTVDTVAL